jgi:ELWxxDGT repeat protein
MKKSFTAILLACIVMPVLSHAQTKHRSYDAKQVLNNKYPGSAYAEWDPVAKTYNWYSPLRGALNTTKMQGQNMVEANASVNAAQVFHLVKDINNETNGYPGNYQPQFHDQHFAVLNGIAYFTANDGTHGSELWRSDGTGAGSYLVKDLEPGTGSPSITNITAANGKLFFTATTSANSTQAWVSDGTDAGTHILKDLSNYIPYNGAPGMYTAVGNKVFFFLGDMQLWVTDGTEAGTKGVSVSYDNTQMKQPVAVGNKLFFTTYSWNYGRQLWKSDGTDAGTAMVKQIGYYYYNGPQQLTAYKGKLYFSADDGYNGRKLWISDGTDAGTYQLNNNNAYLLDYSDQLNSGQPIPQMAMYNNAIYFMAYDYWNNGGTELYKYSLDNSDGVVLVKDISGSYTGTNLDPYEITGYKNGIAFKVFNNDGSASLWTTKGTDADTKLLKTFATYNNQNFSNLYNTGANLSFEAYTPSEGYELWKSNGTIGGTLLVDDIIRGSNSSYPYFTTSIGVNKILFSAKDSSGVELWSSDGTAVGTVLAKDINQSKSESSILTTEVFASTPNGVVFPAFDQAHGSEPYYSEGNTATTTLISDLMPGEKGSGIHAMQTVKDNVYFLVDSDENNLPAIYMFKNTGKQLVKIFEAFSNYQIKSFAVADNGLVFFEMSGYNSLQFELWRSDGTGAGSVLLKTGYYYYYDVLPEMVTIGNTAYLSFADQYYGVELYKSDGTVNGTKLVADLYAGSNGSYPYSLINYNGTLMFGARDEDGLNYLWRSNGTIAGTKKVAQIQVATAHNNYHKNDVYCISNGLLYINVPSDYYNYDNSGLWTSNGTSAGTKQVRKLSSNYDAGINNLTDVNGIVYFSANDGINGNEIWQSNGTLVGTILIRDITGGSSGTNLSDFCSIGSRLYFVANGALWTSTSAGNKTVPVTDAGLQGVYNINSLVAAGNKLFFSGFSDMHGAELYEGDVPAQAIASNNVNNAVAKNLNTLLKAEISPNPVINTAELQLTNAKSADVLLIDNTGKVMWQQTNVNTTHIKIPMQQYTAGLYYVKIVSEGETTTIKLIKQK